MVLNFSGAGAGNQLGERSSANAGKWKVNDIGIAKQIKKKWLDCFQRVRSAKLEEHHTYTPCWVSHSPGFLKKEDVTEC
jgi:hypothetical protein